MKRYVTLTYKTTVVVEAENEDTIYDWAYASTPSEAVDDAHKNGRMPREEYDEYIEYADDWEDADIILD